MTLLLDVALRSSAPVLVALLVCLLLRHHSAALRHRVLAAAVIASVAIVPLSVVLPSWGVPLPGVAVVSVDSGIPVVANADHVVTVAPAGARPIAVASALQVVFLVWIAGVATGGGLLLLRVARLRRLTRKAEAVADGDWRRLTAEIAARYGIRRPVVLLTTGASDILATWGLLTPRVLLPADAPTWSGERARIVLLHELAHIKRWDWAVQMSADAIRTVFWFNPLFWILCARLRREGERASDDIVLGAGVRAATYASHLVDIARLCRRPSGWVPAVSIAHPSTLERRIVAMLNTGLNRQAPTWRATAAILVALVAIVFPTASFDVSAQAGPHALMGSIYDTTGLVLPGVDVTLVDEQDVSRSLVTDTRGAFRFTSVGTGTYVLEVSEPGFRSLRNEFTLETARDWYRNITMQAQSAKPAPPEDSPELFRAMEFRFHPQGEQAQRHYTTYFGMMEGTEYVSKPSLGEWIPYASAAEVVVADAERLWRSGLLDSIWVDVTDQPYENGVAGKHVIFNFVESSQIQPEPAESPVPAPGFENPPPGHERLYPL